MFKSTLLMSALLLALAGSARADGVSYDVTVNTTSIAGTAGSLDFQFNPGPLVTQAADVQILGFTSDGTLGASTPTGDVTGTLPGTISFDNGAGFNDYFTGFTYGDTISFVVNLFGPAVTSPDGTSTSGSQFAFSMFSDSAGAIPVLTTDSVNGFALAGNINLDGTTTLTNFSSDLTVTPVATPEPGTILLVFSGLAGLGLIKLRKSISLQEE